MIKLFIIDDSMLIRNIVKKVLKPSNEIEIIGEATNPVDAMEEFKKVGLPDVFILDIEMPKMDGLSFLKKLKNERPIPTIIFATLVSDKSTKAIEALELGACDIIVKPSNMKDMKLSDLTEEFTMKIKAAANSKSLSEIKIEKKTQTKGSSKSDKIIAIGSSTGGVETLEKVLTHLDEGHPPIVITQHMPAGFTNSFANRLDKYCKNSTAKEAKDGDIVKSGMILIAPGDRHLEIKKDEKNRYVTLLKDYEKVSNHKPSVDVLFKSVAKEAKANGVGFILTGMGKDGAQGMKKIKEASGQTFGQNEESSIVYGMPRVAFEIGALDKQLSLEEIIDMINSMKWEDDGYN